MKKKILWSALLTLIGTQVQADVTEPTATPQNTPSVEITASPASNTGTSNPIPPISAPTQSTQPPINCDYKTPAEIKKIDQAIVLIWAKNATTQAFDFDPEAIDAQLKKLQSCFTDQGWTGFETALQKSGNIEAIKTQKLTVSSQIEEPVLISEAQDNQWKISLPLHVVYQNSKEKVTQLLNVDLMVGRKTNGDLGITQMIAAPRGTVTSNNKGAETDSQAQPATTSATDTSH